MKMTGWRAWLGALALVVPVTPAWAGDAPAPAVAGDPLVVQNAPGPGTPSNALEEVVELKDASLLAQLCRDVKVPGNLQASTPDPVDLRLSVARQVSSRKAALERVYAVVVPSDRFEFEDYDLEQGRLMLATQGGFHVLRGALGLWSTDGDPMEIPMLPARAQEVMAAKKKGDLVLHLFVHLDADPDEVEQDTLKGEPCANRPGTQNFQLAVSWLGGELVDAKGKKNLATFATELGRQTPVLAQRLLGNVELRLGAPEGAGDSASVLVTALEGKRPAINACHEKHGHHAEGGLVLGLDVAKAGVVEKVGIDVDSLGHDAVGRCVLDEVRTLHPTLKVAAGTHVTVPLVWARD